MFNMSHVFKAIFSGISTGLIISIPLGPAGIESVKRTISKNYKEGFLVSLGAITADMSYLFLINCGLSNILSKNKKTEALFWIISGIILSIIGYMSLRKTKNNLIRLNCFKNSNLKSMPFITGFLITFLNPMTLSLWLTLSGTVICVWHHIGKLYYYIFIFCILLGMIIWFAFLNLLALKGISFLSEKATKNTSNVLIYIIIIMGVCFSILGILKYFSLLHYFHIFRR